MSAKDRIFAKLQCVSSLLEHTREATRRERALLPDTEEHRKLRARLFRVNDNLGVIAIELVQITQRLELGETEDEGAVPQRSIG